MAKRWISEAECREQLDLMKQAQDAASRWKSRQKEMEDKEFTATARWWSCKSRYQDPKKL